MDMLALPWLHSVTGLLFILVCILLILVILIQKGRGGGLSGAFGGVGGHSAFGAKTGDVFTWITVGLAGAFLVMAVLLNFVYVKLPARTAAPKPQAVAQPVAGEPAGGAPAVPGTPAAPSPAPSPAPEKPAQ